MTSLLAKIGAGAVALAIGVAASVPAMAGDYEGNFMIRLQGTYLDTQDRTKSATSTVPALDLKSLGYNAAVSNEVLPTATLTYFFNKNVSAELFCCFATANVDLHLNGVNQGQVAKTWMFPPALTLQYHFTDLGAFKPYVGVGVQWIKYFSSSTPGANPLAAPSVNFSDSFGPVLQAGFDYKIGGGWYLNADIKKSFLETKASFNNSAFGLVTVKQAVDPLIVSAGVAYRFNLEDLLGSRTRETLK